MIRNFLRAAVLAAVAFVAPAALAEGFKAETFTLDNGMMVVVLPDHRAPVVTHMVWYRVGGADDPRGVSGISHFLEHLMFKGTPTIPSGEFSPRVARLGGQDNASTSADYTNYYQRVARDRLQTVMEMEADRMRNLVLTDEIVLPERDVIIEERSQRIDNDPRSLLFEQMAASLYLGHPYGVPVIGWRQEMAGLTRADALAHYDRYYAPENAILIVAGDITFSQVRRMAEATYGRIPRRGLAPRERRAAEPPPLTARRVSMSDARAQQPYFGRLWLTPSYTTASRNEAYALDILAQILGGQSGRVSRVLVESRELASMASLSFNGDGLQDRYMAFGALPRQGVSIAQLELGLDDLIADLRTNGVTAEEVERAKTQLRAAAIYARDSQTSMAQIYGVGLTTGESIADIEAWPARITAVTRDEVIAAARKYLVAERSVTGILMPEGGNAP